ncbi:carboxypeptidase [Penicillium brasilianum]|uniref:Carboxypeptidase n=1 Tax=Penicillium brasilianum TaxID=104259 RepID=A0A1S9RS83_PENBI|nr:carboxypeptidase [Penicillium brasilianum]
MRRNYLWAVTALAKAAHASLQQPLGENLQPGTVHLSELDNIVASSPLLSFHRNIVEIPSVSGDEKNVGEFVLEFLSSHNWTVEKQIVIPESGDIKERFNVYAYVGDNRYPDVLLTSHIDTVPPFIPYSLHPPAPGGSSFSRKDLVIAGRGTVDAKASVAAIVFAAIETLRDNPDASIGLLFDVGEERFGDGIKHFSDSDLNTNPPTFHTVIFGEPTELSLVAGHKGGLGLKVIAKGKAAHSGYPWLGDSAISAILPVLSRLDNLENVHPKDGGLLRSDKLGKSTLNIGQIYGGVAGNVVPAYAEASVSVRLAAGTPEDTREILQRAVDEVTGKDGSVILDFGGPKPGGAPPQYFDTDVEGFHVITVNYGTDAASLHIHDQDTPKVRRYLYGPGTIHVAHGDDEAITVGDLEEAVRGYKRLISAALQHS